VTILQSVEAAAESGASIVTSALGGIWGYVATFSVGALGAGGLAIWLTAAVKDHEIDNLKLADAQAQVFAIQDAAAWQHAQDQIALTAAVREAQAQVQIVHDHDTITKEIPVYVKDTSTCITYGLVRLLHSAAAGSDPAADTYTAGKPDDACAPLSWSSLAADYSDDLATGRSNAEQLDALIEYDRKLDEVKP
jgi:hypothetical protein